MGDASPTTSGRIFISYRRAETAYSAGWLYERLADRFGGDKIFKDIDSIELGDDFVEVVSSAVASCDVLLALVGDQWLTITDEEGKRRLDDPADLVRVEIEAALARDVRVIPVLVDGAAMPRADELPASLADMVRRQALELSPNRFDFDTGRLLRALDRTLAGVQATPADEAAKTPVRSPSTEQSDAVQRGNRSTAVIHPARENAATPGWHRRQPRRNWPWAAAAAALALALTATVVILWLGGDDDATKRAPVGVAVGAEGAVYVAESTAGRVTVIEDGTERTVAGGDDDESDYGDGGPATSATLADPRGIGVASNGDLYIADRYHAVVRRVSEDGTISRFAGSYEPGSSGDGGPAGSAQLREPNGIAVGPDGAVYIADSGENRVRRVDTDGTITTVAGTGAGDFGGDGGQATEAHLHWPSGLAVAPDGTLYIADTDNHRIRRIDTDGTITTVAGTGEEGFTSDGVAATDAALHGPQAVAVDPDGIVYIADTGNHRIRRIDTDGTITTVAGTGEEGDHGEGGAATNASLAMPQGIVFAPDGTLYIADTGNDRLCRIAPNGTITTV
jgi:sugar lactone lactonase YvrE